MLTDDTAKQLELLTKISLISSILMSSGNWSFSEIETFQETLTKEQIQKLKEEMSAEPHDLRTFKYDL